MTWPLKTTWFDLNDPNRRAHMNRLRIQDERHYTCIRGFESEVPLGFSIRIPTADIEAFCTTLRKHAAGELGQLAIDQEQSRPVSTVCANTCAPRGTRHD